MVNKGKLRTTSYNNIELLGIWSNLFIRDKLSSHVVFLVSKKV